jgi:ATP-dependent protease ClpP protease subunit
MIEMLSEEITSVQTWSLWQEITSEVSDFKDLLKALRESQDGDHIIINIESPGGDADVGFRLVRAIKGSLAQVHMVVTGPCYSMGSILALAGESLTMGEDTFLMFHTFSYSSGYHKSGDVSKLVEATDKSCKEQFRKSCAPFLTDKEMSSLHDGADLYVWWNSADLDKRKRRHFGGKNNPEV